MAAWARAVRGLLLDVSGVLYDSGGDGGVPIAGSVEAVSRWVPGARRSTARPGPTSPGEEEEEAAEAGPAV